MPAMHLAPGALIFDMDGLMVDSEPLWWSVERALAAEHGKEWSDELALRCIGTGLPNTIHTIRAELGIDIGLEEGVTWLVDTFISRIAELELKPGLEELVAAAKARGLPLAVASSSTQRLVEASLGRFALGQHFQAVICGDMVEQLKPAPDIFLYAAAQLAVEPSDCLVLEDSIAGVRAAVAAGMQVIAVPELDGTAFAELTPHVLADLHQARALLGL